MKTAICAIIKDEHRFLKEWVDWHLNLGFDAIHLFEDKGSESHEEIVRNYSNVFLRRYENDEGVQKLLESQGSAHTQYVLYTWFANNYKKIYDRVAFIDLDEFIFFAENYNLKKLCEEFEPYPAVLLNWKMMGASGRISRPSCGVIEAYTQECGLCEDHLWAYKSFVNLNKFDGFYDLHVAKGFVNTHHSDNKFEYYYDKVWLNHYFTKSLEDWTDRIFKRGGTQNGHRKLTYFFECNKNMNYLKDLYVKKHCEKIPNGTYNIGDNLIAGGNIQKISLLNIGNQYKNLTDKERLEKAIQKANDLGFKYNNREKLVHIIWLGKKDFSSIMQKCIGSWKKYLTTQTVCFWTEESCDMSHPFVKLAYKNKDYAFASDFLRFYIIYKYGGVYIDTDVELIKPITNLPSNFFAIEKHSNSIASGLIFGAEKENQVIKDLYFMYNNFYYEKLNKYMFITPPLVTSYFISRGYAKKDEVQDFLGFKIYPSEYFCPMDFNTHNIEITENTISIHYYLHSWKNK